MIFSAIVITQIRWVCFNDPAWESSGWSGVVWWGTYQLPLSSSPVAGSMMFNKFLAAPMVSSLSVNMFTRSVKQCIELIKWHKWS